MSEAPEAKPAISITFTGAIRDHAKANGTHITDKAVADLDNVLRSLWSIDGANSVSFDVGGGQRGTFADAFRVYGPTGSGTADTPAVKGLSRTEQAVEANRTAKIGKSVALAVEAQRLADEFGNPWLQGRANRTHQAIIANGNPNLATRLKMQAGVR
jgi:hypothetical protein